jgi:D-threo-aldose 1-dehydrogenase
MKTHTIRGGLVLSEIGLGTAQMGNLGRVTSDGDARDAFRTAFAQGISYFDTAPHYGLGLSERRLGSLLAEVPSRAHTLSTKVGRLLVPNPDGEGLRDDEGFDVAASTRRVWDFSAGGVRRSLDESMSRLGTDRIDIVYLHDPDEHWEQAAQEAIPALIELRDQGVIGAIGAGMNQSTMLAEFIRRCDIDVVMCAGRYTLLEQPALQDLMPLAHDRGVGVVVAGVYNSGLLANDRPRPEATYNYAPAPRELVERANALADVCEAHGVSLPAAALQWPLRHPAVVSVVVGARTGNQVQDAIDRYRTDIPMALWEDLADADLLPTDLPQRTQENQ